MTDPDALILAHKLVDERAKREQSKVLSMQDYKDAQKPHLVIQCADATHVVPVAYIEALIAGESVEPLTRPMLAAILKEWLATVEAA